jgi:Family of unknown function (DUF6279)
MTLPDGTIRPRRMSVSLVRILLLFGFMWAASGCGVKLVYNNLDRLAHWTMDDYMKLDPAQEAFFDAQLDVLLYWHRTTQLPLYSKELLELDGALADGASKEELFVLQSHIEDWWNQIQEAGMPMATELLYSASDAQLDQFSAQYAKDSDKYTKPYAKLSLDERRARWAKEYREGMEYFTGGLTNEQKKLIAGFRDRYVPDERAWAEYRQRYCAELVASVRRRGSFTEFSVTLRDMTLNRERWYGDEYQKSLDANRALYSDVSVALLNSLSAEQHEHLSKRLREIAQDLFELSTDLPPNVPTAGCLVTCT